MTLRTATADKSSFGTLMALVAQGKATFKGQRYDHRGVKEIAVDVRGEATPNAQIRIGREFFTTAIRDYDDWREKWWREAVQNAVDAGANSVKCGVVETEGEGGKVVYASCEDNGRGMDEDTLINKFLVLGGTTKQTGIGTTGGFGKAKELLVLPWLSWRLESRDTIVDGSGIEYAITKADTPRKGTKLSVMMPADQATTAAAAIAFIGKCDIPHVNFIVNGEPAKADLKTGDHIRNFGESAALFHNKRKDSFQSQLLVRANGIYMFGLYTSSDVQGTLVIELLKPSIDLLTANRDGFRDYDLRHEVSTFVNRLAADIKSALMKKKGLVREKFKGSGKFGVTSRDLESAMYEAEGSLLPEKDVLSEKQIGSVVRVLASVVEPDSPTNFRATPELAAAMLADLEMLGSNQVEAALKQLSWQPDFFLVNEVEGWHVPKKFYPEHMVPRIRQLLRYWAELCRFVLIQLGSQRTYGVGFVFNPEVGASYIHEDGEDWLMLNPYGFDDPQRAAASILTLSKKDDLAWLYAAAVHECTHIADGIIYHNESFSTAMTRNVAKTANRTKQLNAIRKAVVKRTGGEE